MAESIRTEIDRVVPPDRRFPLVNRVGSKDPITGEFVQWILHKVHPFSPGFTIMRMYRRPTGVKVYSAADDGQFGLLNFLPREQVSLTEEFMRPDVLIAELAACEAGEDDKEDDDPDPDAPDDEPDDGDPEDGEDVDRPTPVPKTTAPTTSNGPTVS